MIRFAEFEARGPVLAAITEARDGNFTLEGIQTSFAALESLSGLHLEGIQLVSQVHGTSVIRAAESLPGVRVLGQADGIVSNVHGAAFGVRVADCVPIFLYDPERHAGALIHAGREGTRAAIAREAVRALESNYSVQPKSLFALIGPSAGPCCYEVDPATAERCAHSGMRVSGRMIDLWSSNRDQLIAAGIPPANVDQTRLCTICNPAFHSYRRTGTTARNLALMKL